MYKRVKERLHFIGIGGIGMSGIAEVLARQGFPVSGSDVQESETTRRLENLGVRIAIGHSPQNLEGVKVVVVSSAISRDNSELMAAQATGLSIVPRAEMLAELMRLRFGVAVAGTHGKTTTTSMLGTVLAQCGEDPTVVVGGKVDALGGNAKLGQGRFLVAEADESDGTFLKLSPVVTVITNIDNDHLDFYGQMEKLRLSFVEFANKVPYYGRGILCLDDPEVCKVLPMINKPIWTYGFDSRADFCLKDFRTSSREGFYSQFEVVRQGQVLATLHLRVPGKYNALNATAALAAALELDLPLEKIVGALEEFSGVRRRFETKGQRNGITVVDDYGHHPTEVAAALSASRQWVKRMGNKGKVLVVFQPHRFTRTQICWDLFTGAFSEADHVFLLDVYSAGEVQIPGITSERLSKEIRNCEYASDFESAVKALEKTARAGDLILTLGAGSVTKVGPLFLTKAGPLFFQ